MKVDTSIGCPVEFYVGICCLIFKYKPIMSFLRRLKIMSQITLVALFLPRSNSIFVLFLRRAKKPIDHNMPTNKCQCSMLMAPLLLLYQHVALLHAFLLLCPLFALTKWLVVSIATSLLAIQSRLTRSDCP